MLKTLLFIRARWLLPAPHRHLCHRCWKPRFLRLSSDLITEMALGLQGKSGKVSNGRQIVRRRTIFDACRTLAKRKEMFPVLRELSAKATGT